MTDKMQKKQKDEDLELVLQGNDQREALSQMRVGDLFSFFSIFQIRSNSNIIVLAEKQPHLLKSRIDSLFTDPTMSETSTLMHVFLYFLELMGIKDESSLSYLVKYISNNQDKSLLKAFDSKMDVSFEKLVFFS
jgi:hypothetical protein